MNIRYVIERVDIAATDGDGVSISCVFHGMSKVFVERRYDSDNSGSGTGGLWNFL